MKESKEARREKRESVPERVFYAFLYVLVYVLVYVAMFFGIPVFLLKDESFRWGFAVIYAVMVGLSIFSIVRGHALIWVILFIHALVTLLVLISAAKTKRSTSLGESDSKENLISELFGGLNPAEAKAKYRNLLKKYHPDNRDGNEEKAQNIIREYELYKEAQR